MAEINIGTLSGGGGGGGGTWLKPEMEGGNDVNITSNQVLTFLHIGDPDEFLRIDMSDTDATLRISDTNQNESDLTPFALTFDWRGDTVYPATAQLNPAELLGITGEGIHPALIRIIALHEDFTVSPIIDLGKGVWTGSFLSSGPITPREVIGQLRFWGQNLTGFVTPGALNNLAQGARIEVVAVDSFTETNAAANMLFYTTPTNSITPQLQMELGSDGELELKNYGTGNFEDNNPAYFAGVDAVGNIIEIDPAAVGPIVGATWIKPELETVGSFSINSDNNYTFENAAGTELTYYDASLIQMNAVPMVDFLQLEKGGITISNGSLSTVIGATAVTVPTNTNGLDLNKASNTGYVLTLDNTLGAGTANRTALRTEDGGVSNPSNVNTDANGDKWVFWNSTTFKGAIGFASGEMWHQATSTGAAVLQRWYLGMAGAPVERMRLTDNGLSILTQANPATALDVNGTIRAKANAANPFVTASPTVITVDDSVDTGQISTLSAAQFQMIDPDNTGMSITVDATNIHMEDPDDTGAELDMKVNNFYFNSGEWSIGGVTAPYQDEYEIGPAFFYNGGQLGLKQFNGSSGSFLSTTTNQALFGATANGYLNGSYVRVLNTSEVQLRSEDTEGTAELSLKDFLITATSGKFTAKGTVTPYLEADSANISFFEGDFNFSAAAPPSNNQVIKMDSGNITGSAVMSETGTAITFAAPLYEIDGAESLPSYSNTGDTDTGMFFPAANEIGFSTGGTEKVRVDALGLVLVTGFTPTGTADAAGVEGALARDDDYIYVKTSAGWKRSALSTF